MASSGEGLNCELHQSHGEHMEAAQGEPSLPGEATTRQCQRDEAGQESDESISQPPFTVLDSESDTIVFGLRSMLHEVKGSTEVQEPSCMLEHLWRLHGG